MERGYLFGTIESIALIQGQYQVKYDPAAKCQKDHDARRAERDPYAAVADKTGRPSVAIPVSKRHVIVPWKRIEESV